VRVNQAPSAQVRSFLSGPSGKVTPPSAKSRAGLYASLSGSFFLVSGGMSRSPSGPVFGFVDQNPHHPLARGVRKAYPLFLGYSIPFHMRTSLEDLS
jgi:hypothetical protein